jgi:hypothetical protein
MNTREHTVHVKVLRSGGAEEHAEAAMLARDDAVQQREHSALGFAKDDRWFLRLARNTDTAIFEVMSDREVEAADKLQARFALIVHREDSRLPSVGFSR